MKPLYYCDCEVKGGDRAEFNGHVLFVLARLMRKVHSHAKNHPGQLAVDIPGLNAAHKTATERVARLGRVVRLFCERREDLEAFLDAIESDPVLSDAMRLGGFSLHRVRAVPASFSGPWVSVERTRIAPRSQPDNRRRDIEERDRLKPGFLNLRSASTQQTFSLSMIRRQWKSMPDGEQGDPSSYGLSRKDRPLLLPDMNA